MARCRYQVGLLDVLLLAKKSPTNWVDMDGELLE